MFLMGEGFRDNGQFPFVDQFNINSHEKVRLYESSYNHKKETLGSNPGSA